MEIEIKFNETFEAPMARLVHAFVIQVDLFKLTCLRLIQSIKRIYKDKCLS